MNEEELPLGVEWVYEARAEASRLYKELCENIMADNKLVSLEEWGDAKIKRHLAQTSLKLIAENEDLAAVKFAENALRQALQAKVETLEEERQSVIDTMDAALTENAELQQRVSELEALVRKAYKEGCGGPSDYAEKKWIQSIAREALKKAEATDGE